MNTDFLTVLLASLFERFKMKNPKTAAILLLVFLLIVYFAQQGTLLGVLTIPKWASDAIGFVAALLAAVTSTRTTAYLDRPEQMQREKEYEEMTRRT